MTIHVDENSLKEALLGLVVAVVDVLRETLTLEAVRQMEAGLLSADQAERVGQALRDLEEATWTIRQENRLGEVVDAIRNGLDRVVSEGLDPLLNPKRWEEGV